ncbi:MAG: hypothetical protein ACAI44_12765 [Candidatus Sericytochromatia bacterium]
MKILAGMLLVPVLHLGAVFVSMAVSAPFRGYPFIFFLAGIGLFQCLYILPLAWYLKRKQRPELAMGLLLGAGLSLLLNGLCWAVLPNLRIAG